MILKEFAMMKMTYKRSAIQYLNFLCLVSSIRSLINLFLSKRWNNDNYFMFARKIQAGYR